MCVEHGARGMHAFSRGRMFEVPPWDEASVVHATAITRVTSSRLTWAVSIKGPGVVFEWPAAVWRRASADGQAASPDPEQPHHSPSKFGGHVNKGKSFLQAGR